MDFSKTKYIVIGGSAGSFRVITRILAELPEDFPIPIIMCLHRLKHIRTGFVEALQIKSKLKVKEPFDKESIKKSHIYLAPANYHLLIEIGNTFSLSIADIVNYSRPSIDLTFESAADTFKQKLVAILLSGANKDGSKGIEKVKQNKGITVVQDPIDSQTKTMPQAAINTGHADFVYNTDDIIKLLLKIKRDKLNST